jgi:predicted PurR-regulated permease PerM
MAIIDELEARRVWGDLPRTILRVAILSTLIVGTLWTLRPFLGAVVWATTVVVATWPLMLALQARLGGRRWPAAAVMTVLLLLLLIVPLSAAILMLVAHTDTILEWATSMQTLTLPPAPSWLEHIPVVGRRIESGWQRWVSAPGALAEGLRPYARAVSLFLLGLLGGAATMVLQFLLIVAISAVLYARGEVAARFLRRFGHRIAGGHGERSVVLAGRAIRGVALGVVVTALIQAMLAGIGLVVTGVPFAGLLTAAIVLLTIAQVGPIPILLPAVAWLYSTGDVTRASGLLVWMVLVAGIDNVIRPILIRKGADLPLLLIFAGVIGGMFGFGIIGIFIGPVILAVTYTLLLDWMNADNDGALP